jgi:rhamnulokinase
VSAGAVAAVDLGASSGRVFVGHVGPSSLDLAEAHRFPNDPVALPDGLHWDVLRLQHEVVEGLRRATEIAPELASVGIDGWGVDYGLLDADGGLLGNPYHYRDGRTARGVQRVHAIVPFERLYARTGIQFLPINTIYQLAAELGTAARTAARTMLLLPDLLAYWLTGSIGAEATNASTTGLLDAADGSWALDLVAALGLDEGLLPPIRQPGDVIGPPRSGAAQASGLPPTLEITTVGSHDTASAVVGIPMEDTDAVYISSGTWSLVGTELDRPILDEASRLANFTNERGVDGNVRYLRNVMGLWLLQESMRCWEREGAADDLDQLLQAAAELPGGASVIDVDDPVLLPPGDMPARIADMCRATDQPVPTSRPAFVRCILDSLARAYARTIVDVARLTGREASIVHVVGGGSRNGLLCQLTADACGLPVVAGPVEATALGNVMVQARARGLIHGDLATLRALVRATQPLRRFEPSLV